MTPRVTVIIEMKAERTTYVFESANVTIEKHLGRFNEITIRVEGFSERIRDGIVSAIVPPESATSGTGNSGESQHDS